MEFESDEMFRLLKVRISEWSHAAKTMSTAVNAAGSTTTAAAKAKKKPVKNEEAKKDGPAFIPDATLPGEKKDLT